MSLAAILMPLLIAASSVIYAIFAGRAQATRLRALNQDVSNRKLRGYLTLSVVIAMILASLLIQA